MNAPELKFVQANGVRLAYFERGKARADKPTLLFVHATGFHGRLWDYQAEAFPEYHSIALELRAHGRSENASFHDWSDFGVDQSEFIKALGLQHVVGIAHSMGAHTLLDAAAVTGVFDRLLLLDPTVAEPEAYNDSYEASFGDQLHPAAKRRNEFDSPEDMLTRLSGKSSFPFFHPRILRDYCEYGLEATGHGNFRLCCPPELEARVYMTARTNGEVYDSIRSLDIPVTIVRAKLPDPDAGQDFSSSPTWPELAGEFPQAKDLHWSDCSHFIPMQRPDDVNKLLAEELQAWRS
ncbi:MAG: alpha/beta hydrolase [Pseudomonadales bacterium]|jgi:pimeloyl-ACP methyl ester carboxylesterase|nr:alpha/beta hydrolase [Pseudomonadales bacterium]